jgi:ribosome modulation factor
MEADVDPFQNNNPLAAAYTAMDNPNFYNVTLKNFAAPWTNRDRSVFVPLNDYIATVIGMIRDEIPFNTLLSADILYVGASGLPISGYSPSSNQHYADMESQSLDLSSPAVLQQRVQSSLPGSVPAPATAGVLTSRAAAEAFFIAGTNRAMFRFTMLNHMCNDMEQVHDVKRPPDRIRQDVSRSPGGDSRLFLNNCIGCHSGMDPMAGAFAYYNYNDATGNIEYTNGVVQPKYFNNEDNFPFGYVTTDDSWLNYWREGQNQFLGWDPGLPGTGNGAKSLGIEFGNSDAFANCQVKKVFKTVCLREPEDQNDRNQVATMVGTFRAGNTYSMKRAFADAAVYCMGQ